MHRLHACTEVRQHRLVWEKGSCAAAIGPRPRNVRPSARPRDRPMKAQTMASHHPSHRSHISSSFPHRLARAPRGLTAPPVRQRLGTSCGGGSVARSNRTTLRAQAACSAADRCLQPFVVNTEAVGRQAPLHRSDTRRSVRPPHPLAGFWLSSTAAQPAAHAQSPALQFGVG